MAKLVRPVIIAALVVVIVMLYGQVRELRQRLAAIEATVRAEARNPSRAPLVPPAFVEDRNQDGSVFHPALHVRPLRKPDDAVIKGLKADEFEMRARRIEFIKQLEYQFSPENQITNPMLR
ncbi:MAG TPA: hypothetical protein VF175_15535 [Lacipirellula sp.]